MSTADVDLSKIPPALLEKFPAGTPPPGLKSNLINPISRGPESKIVVFVMLPLMIIPLLMRLYVRGRIQRSWGGDDLLAIVSALCVGGYCGILIYLVDGPGGENVWDLPISRITSGVMKAHLAGQCMYALASIFTKSTLLFLYLRIFRPAFRAVNLIWFGIAFILLSHIACTIAQIVILVPRPGKTWFSTTTDKVQDAATTVVAAQGVISVLTDFYVLCIPMSLAVGLHLPIARKVGVCAIFLTGLMASICSLVGTVIRFRLRNTQDMFWDSIPAYTLTVIELSAGVICACMPVLPVLIKHVSNKETYRRSISMLRYFRGSSKNSSEGEKGSFKSGSEKNEDKPKVHLTIPKPTMTGLRTFIRGGNRSQINKSVGGESFAQLDSFDDEDYHAQLKRTTR